MQGRLDRGRGNDRREGKESGGEGIDLAGISSKVFSLGDWDGNWVYSNINKDRNMGRGGGFMEKVISCFW